MLLSAEKICKGYGIKPLLSDVSFYLNEGEKVGVIGINGTGKSTFLRILAGIDEADDGIITKGQMIRIGYLSQNPDFQEDMTVLTYVLTKEFGSDKNVEEYEAKGILNRLGITDFEQKVSELSGGEKKRVSIAKALVVPYDILILDEPTNHLDSQMVLWLEQYLIQYKGAIIMITHDRYFLDRVTNKIVEIDKGNLYSYDANYSLYLEMKAQREEMELASERKRQTILRKELAWMRQGIKARGTRSRGRVERYEELRDRDGIGPEEKVDISSMASRLGKKTIEIRQIEKKLEGRTLISNFEYIVLREDRVGIIGKNGCGKSTLLKMIMGVIEPDQGVISIGDTVKIGYFSQENETMDLSMKAIDYIRNIAENVMTDDGMISASVMMERFLFPSDLQYNIIARLSGGERRRLFLLGILMSAPNILLLDEPTNDLDIETLTILEDYLDHFHGAVIAVSHDRYFLDRVVQRVLAFEEKGEIILYNGGYSDYLENMSLKLDESEKENKGKEKIAVQKEKKQNENKKKMSYNEQREYSSIDQVIVDLEGELQVLTQLISKETTDYDKLQKLLRDKEDLELALEQKMERWVYLNELAGSQE